MNDSARATQRHHGARPGVLADLRGTRWERLAGRGVKDELRSNLIAKLRAGEPLFPGILGYDDTVTPAVVNAVLSRHNFILLGLRGQAKTRILRQLVELLDEEVPYIAGTELHDDPFAPVTVQGRAILEECGDATPIAWLPREAAGSAESIRGSNPRRHEADRPRRAGTPCASRTKRKQRDY